MIGAGIFALTGQIAELAGPWFPLAFLGGAVVTGFSAYTYVKMSNALPSAGGIEQLGLEPRVQAGGVPAVLDVSLGELRPIREPFLESRLGDRNAIIGVLQAPLVRVDTSGDGCLRVRAEPSLDGEVLTCLAHGAMLAMLTPRDPSAAWIEVAGPGGLNGWASAEFLVETTVRPPK